MTIPTVLPAGLVVFLFSKVPPAVIPAALLITGAALLTGGTQHSSISDWVRDG
jgi:hypothetical protein